MALSRPPAGCARRLAREIASVTCPRKSPAFPNECTNFAVSSTGLAAFVATLDLWDWTSVAAAASSGSSRKCAIVPPCLRRWCNRDSTAGIGGLAGATLGEVAEELAGGQVAGGQAPAIPSQLIPAPQGSATWDRPDWATPVPPPTAGRICRQPWAALELALARTANSVASWSGAGA